MNERTFVLKGTICYSNSLTELSITENGYLVCEDGRCAGVFDELPEKFAGISCTDFGDELIIPGLTDLHLHAPQYTFRASGMDLELLDWLNTYTFPQEARYEDTEFAKEAYSIFTEDMKKSPNTRACIFGTLHVPATEILMEQLDKTGIKAMVGKVNMDRNGSPQLQEESAQASADATVQWIKDTLDKFENVKPILTPRFTPSCSDALMEKLSEIQKKYHLPTSLFRVSRSRYLRTFRPRRRSLRTLHAPPGNIARAVRSRIDTPGYNPYTGKKQIEKPLRNAGGNNNPEIRIRGEIPNERKGDTVHIPD